MIADMHRLERAARLTMGDFQDIEMPVSAPRRQWGVTSIVIVSGLLAAALTIAVSQLV